MAMYHNIVNCHIKPELGHLPLNKVVRSDIQKLINDNQQHPHTCEQIKMTLSQIFNCAIDDKLIHENIAKKATLPKRHKKERRALTSLEKVAIKKADFTLQKQAFIMPLFYFGLRRGEALALSKPDIDLKKKTVSANKTVIFDKNNHIIKTEAKSDAGNPEIPIPENVMAFLREFLKSANTFFTVVTVFLTDDSLLKMLYLAMIDITKKWTSHRQDWGQIHSQLEIYFEKRLSGRNL